MYTKYKIVPFCPIPFCPYHFVQYHFVRIPFCPYHFVRYHFVRSPCEAFALQTKIHSQLPWQSILKMIVHRPTHSVGIKIKQVPKRRCRPIRERKQFSHGTSWCVSDEENQCCDR